MKNLSKAELRKVKRLKELFKYKLNINIEFNNNDCLYLLNEKVEKAILRFKELIIESKTFKVVNLYCSISDQYIVYYKNMQKNIYYSEVEFNLLLERVRLFLENSKKGWIARLIANWKSKR